MSNNKYADLPDIDTAPDIYETEDAFPSLQTVKDEASDDEVLISQRTAGKTRNDTLAKQEIDSSNLIDPEMASQRFRRAKTRHNRLRTHYGYPASPTSPSPTEESRNKHSLSLSQRLRALQEELVSLETELEDPSNPRLAKEREVDNVDPGELIRGLVDVRKRIDKVRKTREGRAKLIGVLLGEDDELGSDGNIFGEDGNGTGEKDKGGGMTGRSLVRATLEIDRRVGKLEKLVGSSSVALDETSPLPPPLFPLITKLNAQLTLFTQPRHIDSISRRLKLLLSDLDRVSSQHYSHRRHPSQSDPQASHIQDHVLPLLSRLGLALPHIPHILTRLRTLAALHSSASEFEEALRCLESEQQGMHEALNELEAAVKKVEASLEENHNVVRGNVAGLESRVDSLLTRLEVFSQAEAT